MPVFNKTRNNQGNSNQGGGGGNRGRGRGQGFCQNPTGQSGKKGGFGQCLRDTTPTKKSNTEKEPPQQDRSEK